MQRDEQAEDSAKVAQKDQPHSNQQKSESLIEAQKKASEERQREGGYQ
jgi:hypothetical protein